MSSTSIASCAVLPLHAHHDLALRRELDRVRHQIDDHLAKVLAVGHQRRGHARLHREAQARAASVRRAAAGSPAPRAIVVGDVDRPRVPVSSFGLIQTRQIEDRLGRAQQLLGAAADARQRAREPLGRHPRRDRLSSSASHTITASGVRSSWLAARRNFDFAALAASASAWARRRLAVANAELTDEDVHAVADRVQLVAARARSEAGVPDRRRSSLRARARSCRRRRLSALPPRSRRYFLSSRSHASAFGSCAKIRVGIPARDLQVDVAHRTPERVAAHEQAHRRERRVEPLAHVLTGAPPAAAAAPRGCRPAAACGRARPGGRRRRGSRARPRRSERRPRARDDDPVLEELDAGRPGLDGMLTLPRPHE